MYTESKVIMMHGPFDARLDTVPLPPLGDDEVQCKSVKSLISVGTEAIQYARNQDASMHRVALDLGKPHKTSYNTSAEVVAVGKNVKDYKVGDKVYALVGHEQYFNIRPSLLTHMPDWISHEENAWMTILRTGLFSCMQAGLKPYDTIVIAGLGIFGFATLMAAKIYNAKNIIVVEPEKYRADKAKAHGATHVLNAKIGDVLEDIIELNDGKLVDVAVDATAWAGNIKHCQYVVKRNGNVTVICDPPNTDSQIMNYGFLHYRGQHVHGVYINMMLAEPDPCTDQREFVNPFYPMTMQDIHTFLYEKFKTGEINVKDLIAGYVSPMDCAQVYHDLHYDRGQRLGTEYDWTMLR